MATFKLTTNAQNSLCGIKLYSAQNFGDRQTAIYIEKIYEKMKAAAEKPERGKRRDDLIEGLNSINAGSHVIYYTVKDTHIDIVDVLHQRMEPRLHLFNDD